MSGFGGSSFGSGGFGSNNNTTSSLFGGGGFGSNNNANNNTSGGFGNQNSNTFGSNNTNTGSGFGGFGSTNNNNSAFGAAKPAFGGTTTNTGGSLFGSSNNNATTGGFGSGGFGSNNATTSTFGAGNTGGSSLFGAAKPASTFGNTGGSLFGGSTFGASNTNTTPSTGFGTNAASGECLGTAQPAYQVTQEKEANSNVMNHFQSIVHMPSYAKWSFEELRLADYNAGRKVANASGQAGGFGASTGFGGFSNNNNTQTTGGGLFGNNNNTATTSTNSGGLFGGTNTNTGFGTNNQTTSSFGGGFGANKPASTGGLFGSTNNTTTQNQTSLFGGSGGFGSNNTTTGFGTNNNNSGGFGATAAKPSLFGTTNTNTGGGLFGNNNANANTNTGGGLFGNNNQTQSTGFGAAQTNTTSNPFGGASNTGGGLFGNNNQQKPGGLFGSTPAANTGSLFGSTQQNTQPSGGLFGNSNTTGTTGGLFGAAKPATTSLFGAPAQQQNQGTSLFGNNQQAQPTQGGLFGSAAKPAGGLFGASTSQNNTGGQSLFGNSQQQQQQQQNSMFGQSMNTNQPVNLQPPQGLTASIFDQRPYGSVSIFDGLPPPPNQNVGPIATPIAAGQKIKKPAVLPQWKINPTMSPRFVTPQKQGYGFSYSRYGTPSSISSVASTPGHFGNSLLGSSIGRNLGKSVSVSNLRRNYDADAESILAPGAFSSASRLGSQHSLKKLNIDRNLRNDLFAPVTQGSSSNDRGDSRSASSLKKRVSFEATSLNNGMDEDVPRITNTESSPTPTAEEQGYLRSSTSRNLFNGQPAKERRSQETSPVKGNELAIVPEDGSPEALPPAPARTSSSSRPGDPQPGNYYTRPSIEEIKRMAPEQLKKVSGFVVSRENVGSCAFQQPVDLSGIKWDNFFDVMVKFGMRSICVYPDQSKKPPVGMGINVPSVITLENCWPRSRSVRSGPRLDKHIRHLQNVTDCDFISYNVDKGEWTFKVPHFTTYGLDYDEEDEMDTDAPNLNSSVLSETFSEVMPAFLQNSKDRTQPSARGPVQSEDENDFQDLPQEDTFGFKGAKQVPGGFDSISVSDDEEMEMQQVNKNALSFLDKRSAVQESEDEDEPSDIPNGENFDEQSLAIQDTDLDLDMAGAFPDEPANFPKSILKHSTFEDDKYIRPQMFTGDDWAEQLQRTISPRKRDRQELKASQAFLFRDANGEPTDSPTKKSKVDNKFETSIDLMNSLFGKEKLRQTNVASAKDEQIVKKGFQWPYNKNGDHDSTDIDENEQAFHESFKPHWGPGNVLVHAIAEDAAHQNTSGLRGPEMKISGYLVSEGYDVRLSRFDTSKELNAAAYERQFNRSKIVLQDGLPMAESMKLPLAVHDFESITQEETLIWNLASILFDKHDDHVVNGLSAEQRKTYKTRMQKNRLSTFWTKICKDDALQAVGASSTAEEKAIHFLSMGAVVEACNALTNGKDFRLATLVSQIGGDKIMHQDMSQQIKEWRRLNVLSEMNDSIRTLYEMLAGNVCVSEGRQGPIEDRAATFTISQKYKLTWARAFGLRLWYAIGDDEPLEAAVKKYSHELNGPETAKPKPWFLEKDGYNPPWSDPDPEGREDVLWGLLKLFTNRNDSTSSINLSDVIAPENVRGNPIDNRLSWELFFALLPHMSQQETDIVAGDKLTVSLAAELESARQWEWAIFVLLHLTKAEQRQVAIRDLLARQAAVIDIDNEKTQDSLFNKLQLPQSWVYEAKALYARSVDQNLLAELHYLQKAGNWNEAHKVLCRTVAPKAIIEREYEMLNKVLTEFEHGEKPHNWRTGGAVYADYLHLLSAKDKSERENLLKHLVRSVADMANSSKGGKKRKGTAEKGSESEGFLQSVADKEMGWVSGDMLLHDRENDKEHATGHAQGHGLILHLPLSDEMRRERSREVGIEYYRKVMAMGS